MKFECVVCEKLVDSQDVILVVIHGGFGNVQGWEAYCPDCYNKRSDKQ